ncbi:GNAT family N-acetyltransferase [Planktotalea sp.]|uniref:GNAT family N-acetyltransferase n=1 Tax=Planktotalea sp. TaxID=2029877 RepID=UPI0025D5FBB7|nr:GNAT family N-acetyltransferase [Planktotalea sp.]
MTLRHAQAPTGIPSALAANVAAQIPTLVSDALLLRAPLVEDFSLYAEVMCSERGQYMGGPLSRDDAWWGFVQLASGWMLHGHGGWSIVDVDSEELLGFVILGLEPGDQQIELGVLVSESNEGLSIAHEAAQMARTFAFDTLKLTELASYIHKDNTRSITLAERLGAKRTVHDDTILAYIHTNEAVQ